MANLSTLSVQEAMAGAKAPERVDVIVPAGKQQLVFAGNVEEETYNALKFQWQGKPVMFFYNPLLKDSTDLNQQVLDWIKALANITITDKTNFQEIFNSAIGSTYEIEVRNYTSQKGKNAGKVQHAIDFAKLPVKVMNTIQTEDITLPF